MFMFIVGYELDRTLIRGRERIAVHGPVIAVVTNAIKEMSTGAVSASESE